MNDRIRGTLSNLSNTLDLAALSNGTSVATPPRQGGEGNEIESESESESENE